MSKPYRLVVFDWEGTLSDTLGQILNCVAVEARQLGFGELDESLARQSVGLGLVMALRRVFPDLTDQEQEQLLTAVHQSFISKATATYLIPGAKEIVKRLADAGIDLAIASNKGHQSLQRALQACGLDIFFRVTRSPDLSPAKPCPQMLEEILDEFNIEGSEALMVGDSLNDIEMALSLGVDVIGVDFYHQHEADLRAAGALDVFDDFQQLATYLQLPEERGTDL